MTRGEGVAEVPDAFEVKRVTVHDQVRDHLLGLIRSGGLPRGSALPPERELAATLGVSRHSLRQALASLQAVGLVEARHGSGVYLATQPSDEAVVRVADVLLAPDRSLVDVLEARLAIEPSIASCAARRRTAEDVAFIVTVLDGDPPSGDRVRDASREAFDFHQWLAMVTGNPVLQGIMRSLTTGEHGVAALIAAAPGKADLWEEQHRQILQAVADSDQARAGRLMSAHVEQSLATARAAEH